MKTTLSVLGALIIVIGLALYYYGFFTRIQFSEKKMGPFYLVYEKHIGNYKETEKIMDRIYEDVLNNYTVRPTGTFSMYYNDPELTYEHELKSLGGCFFEFSDNKQRDEIEKQLKILRKKYRVQISPWLTTSYCEFPFKGKLSVLFARYRISPKLIEHIMRGGYRLAPITELFYVPDQKMLVTVQTGFYPTFRMMR